MWGGGRPDIGDMADSLLSWWRDAGVTDCVADAPRPWLDRSPAVADAAPVEAPVPAAPRDLPQWLASLEDTGQPDARWPGAFTPPRLVAGSALLVITDMPDEDAPDGEALSPIHGALLSAMLRAIGMDMEATSLASLAVRRPAGGFMDEDALMPLASRARQLIALTTPRQLLLFGDRTARALGATGGDGLGNPLRAVNHADGTVQAVALPHLLLLAQKPRLKARSWQSLRHLKEMTA